MIRKTRTSDRFLYAIVVFCIFSIKISLLGAGGSSIRPDDILIFLAFLILLLRGDMRRIERSRAFNVYLIFVAVNILSCVWNTAMGRVDPFVSAFFVVRLLQYMIFYYLGYLIARRGVDITRMLSYYLAMLCVMVPLQMVGILSVSGISFTGIMNRAVGNTNGPYELAAVAAFLLCYLGYKQKKWIQGVVSLLLVFLTAARITSVAAVFSVAKIAILRRTKSRRGFILGVASLVAAGIIGVVAAPYISSSTSNQQIAIFRRLSSVTSTGISYDTLSKAYEAAPVYVRYTDYLEGEFTNSTEQVGATEGDRSGLYRVFRWTTLIKSTLNGFDTTLIGLGPSFGWTAVDGYYVRVFTETGVLGLLVFCWFAKALLFRGDGSLWAFREYAFMLLATGCFVDIFVSYKPMLLLWLWHGMNQFNLKNKPYENDVPNLKLSEEIET
jgi:hypothetical protein